MKTSWLDNKGILILFFAFVLLALAWTAISLDMLPGPGVSEISGTNNVAETIPESALILRAEYQVIANKSTIIWPQGSLVEQGRAGYFYAILPSVNVTPVLEVHDLIKGQLTGTMQSGVYLQAATEKGEVYWSYQLSQSPAEAVSFAKGATDKPDEVVFKGSPISIDVMAAYNQLERISEELKFNRALFQLIIQSDVKIAGIVNDVDAQKNIKSSYPLTLHEESFSLPTPDESITTIVLATGAIKPVTPKKPLLEMLADNWLPLLIDVILLLILLYLLKSRRMKRKTGDYEHRRFKEWITEGSIQVQDRVRINVHSLEGLVDLAIDLDKRVIFDPETKKYYVLEENLVYIFDYEVGNSKTSAKTIRLGKLLLERGVIRPEQLEMGLFYQQRSGQPLGESLMSLGFIDEITLTSALAAQAKLPYLELNPEKIKIEPKLFKKLTLNQARALSAVPLGVRKDGKLVIACAETFREGFQKSLQEIFAEELFIVAARPSVIYKLIEQMEPAAQVQQQSVGQQEGTAKDNKLSRLSFEEQTRFVFSYYQGSVNLELFIKASGLVETAILASMPEPGSGSLIQWLVNHSYIDGTVAHLISGVRRAVQIMDWQSRQEKRLPELIEVLHQADYLPGADINWLRQESSSQGKPPEDFLIENYLATAETVKKAIWLLDMLEKTLTNTPEEQVLDVQIVQEHRPKTWEF